MSRGLLPGPCGSVGDSGHFLGPFRLLHVGHGCAPGVGGKHMLTFGQHVLPAWVLGPFLALLWAAWAARGGARMGAGRPGAARTPRRVPLLCWLGGGLVFGVRAVLRISLLARTSSKCVIVFIERDRTLTSFIISETLLWHYASVSCRVISVGLTPEIR